VCWTGEDPQARVQEGFEVAPLRQLLDGNCDHLLGLLSLVSERHERSCRAPFELLALDVLFTKVLLRLKEIVSAAVQRDVRRRRGPAAGDRTHVLVLEAQRRTAAPVAFAYVGAASPFAVVDLAPHGRGDAAPIGGWVRRHRRPAGSLGAAVAPPLEHL